MKYIAASYFFISLLPYFVWNSRIELYLSLVFFFISSLTVKSIDKTKLTIYLFLLVFLGYLFFPGAIGEGESPSRLIALAIKVAPLFLLNQKTIDQSWIIFLKIFALSLVPGLIYYLLFYTAGITFEFESIEALNSAKAAEGIVYQKIPGMVLLGGSFFTRFCGMFDEPGVVGTIAALCIIKNSKINSWYMFIILLGGIFSLSAAFFVLIATYLVVTLNKSKVILALISVFLIIAPAYINWQGKDLFYTYTIERFISKKTKLDNRISDKAQKEMEDKNSGRILEILIGHGCGATSSLNASISSWKIIFFDKGILGLLGYGVLFFCLTFSAKNDTKHRFLILFFIALSFYQRPGIIKPFYILISIARGTCQARSRKKIELE